MVLPRGDQFGIVEPDLQGRRGNQQTPEIPLIAIDLPAVRPGAAVRPMGLHRDRPLALVERMSHRKPALAGFVTFTAFEQMVRWLMAVSSHRAGALVNRARIGVIQLDFGDLFRRPAVEVTQRTLDFRLQLCVRAACRIPKSVQGDSPFWGPRIGQVLPLRLKDLVAQSFHDVDGIHEAEHTAFLAALAPRRLHRVLKAKRRLNHGRLLDDEADSLVLTLLFVGGSRT